MMVALHDGTELYFTCVIVFTQPDIKSLRSVFTDCVVIKTSQYLSDRFVSVFAEREIQSLLSDLTATTCQTKLATTVSICLHGTEFSS